MPDKKNLVCADVQNILCQSICSAAPEIVRSPRVTEDGRFLGGWNPRLWPKIKTSGPTEAGPDSHVNETNCRPVRGTDLIQPYSLWIGKEKTKAGAQSRQELA